MAPLRKLIYQMTLVQENAHSLTTF